MKKIFEQHLAEIIVITVIALSLSSCSSNHYLCDAYASTECENCDEID